MKSATRIGLALVCIAVVGWVSALPAAGAAFSGFGRSVDFQKSAPEFCPEKLKGKGALVIFFQSWCPKCNSWSGRLFKELEEAYGENPGLMMIAIKTDGGSARTAESYMKGRGADMDKWFVGADKGAAYYKKVTGTTGLYGYVLICAKGGIVKKGNAGMFWSSGAQKGKFSLATSNITKHCGKLDTLLPIKGEYPGKLIRIARLAEMGALGDAMKQLSSATRSKHKEAAKALQEKLSAAIKERVTETTTVLNDKGKDWSVRYEAYKKLAGLCEELSGQSVVAEARRTVLTMGRQPAIRNEAKAEKEYDAMMIRFRKASDRSRPSVARQLKRIGDRYPNTKYGKLALEEAGRALDK